MPTAHTCIGFALVAFGLVVTPGPNMMYLVSRSICQGRAAGLLSLVGVGLGFLFYVSASALGLTVLLVTVPFAYDALRAVGSMYLLYLAWGALKPGGRSPFQVRTLPKDSPAKLVTMGLLTNLLNPKAAMLYLSLLPQFISPSQGSVLTQSLVLGLMQIVISLTVNGLIILSAGTLARFLQSRPTWAVVQRWLMGTVLGGLAVKMAVDSRK
jgi:threonine/homoserine/homoserine lactone efflux protein